MRVLIAEDERITRTTLARQLARWGHEVVVAENGMEAWKTFCDGRFDIVLTDWEMPELSGVELVQRIRDRESPEYVYLVLLTSRSDKSDVISGIEAGADDFVSKPFDHGELRVRLLAGERVVRLERALKRQNLELRESEDRLRRDLRAASRVQRAMLPTESFAGPSARACFEYVPTDELGGDGLGFHMIENRFLISYVVDVTGHGVPAALLAVTAMHALSPEAGGLVSTDALRDGWLDPASVVAELNRRFCASGNDGRFLTMILCVLDMQTGRFRFSRAGHPLPIISRNGHAIAVDEKGGLPLGIVADETFESVETRLEPGDRIFLYSDGFAEQAAVDSGAQFGEARLRELVLAGSERSIGEVAAHVVSTLADWAGSRRFTDDVSFVSLEWTGG